MKIDKYKITTLIFLIIISIMCVKTFWNNKNSFAEAFSEGNLIADTNQIYSENVAYYDFFIDLWSESQNVLSAQLLDDAEYGVIIKDSKGFLHFPSNDVNVEKYANNTIEFANKLKDKNIPFVYIQASNKDLKGYTDEIVSEYNFSNKNATEFLEILNQNNIHTFDLRDEIIKDNLERENLFYKTDHHWTTSTAFWAFTKILSLLENTFNFDIPSGDFYKDINNYKTQKISDCYLGSLGRRVGESVAGLDDYLFIEPNFETSYNIYDGLVSLNKPAFSGNFRKSIVKEHILTNTDVTSNKHASYFEWDYGNLIIKNKLVKNDVKILLIKDSYSLPVAAFLSTAIEELHMIDLRDASTINLMDYVDENNLDAVMIMYNTEIFTDTMFNFNSSIIH